MKCIIIDDEPKARQLVKNLLMAYFPNIEVLALVGTVDDAVAQINLCQPDFIFLDIEMPFKNGFALFDYFAEVSFQTIFITAYEKYALEAFRVGSTDYITKPISPVLFVQAVNRVIRKVDLIDSSATSAHPNSRIPLKTKHGVEIEDTDNVLYIEADDNYTYIHLKDRRVYSSKTLKYFERQLERYGFFRISRKHLINLAGVKSVSNHKAPEVMIGKNTNLLVSPQRKKDLMKVLDRYLV